MNTFGGKSVCDWTVVIVYLPAGTYNSNGQGLGDDSPLLLGIAARRSPHLQHASTSCTLRRSQVVPNTDFKATTTTLSSVRLYRN